MKGHLDFGGSFLAATLTVVMFIVLLSLFLGPQSIEVSFSNEAQIVNLHQQLAEKDIQISELQTNLKSATRDPNIYFLSWLGGFIGAIGLIIVTFHILNYFKKEEKK